MRRWGRRITLATLIVLLIALLCGWVRSYFEWESILLIRNNTQFESGVGTGWVKFSSGSGSVAFEFQSGKHFPDEEEAKLPPDPDWEFEHIPLSDGFSIMPFVGNRGTLWHWGGFWIGHGEWAGPSGFGESRFLVAPYWAVSGFVSLPLMIWCALKYRARKNRLAGNCVVCGYDLRATPDRCPECGAVPLIQQQASS